MSTLPVVAIVGRPNVGKSTLFNRFAGERIAIVEDVPGTTRDRVYASGDWNGREFTMAEADVILFVVDAQAGLAPLDYEVADRLRRSEKPVILVINKADNPRREQEGAEFHALGFDPTITVSAQHGRNTGDLADLLVEALPPEGAEDRAPASVPEELTEDELEELAETEMGPPRVAIVGRPNTGKSTLVNRVLGEERMIVSEIPGTTRDPVDSAVVVDGEPMILVDTAGIRRRGAIEHGIERYSVLRAMKAIDRADVAVVMTDAVEGYTAQDAHVVGHVLDAGKGLVLVLNKWDAVAKDEKTADERLGSRRATCETGFRRSCTRPRSPWDPPPS